MAHFVWQAVVIEAQGSVTHFGKTGPLRAGNLKEAQQEVESLPPRYFNLGNCFRILQGTQVISSRVFDTSTNRIRWTEPRGH